MKRFDHLIIYIRSDQRSTISLDPILEERGEHTDSLITPAIVEKYLEGVRMNRGMRSISTVYYKKMYI
jgi:hypothetical protein